MRDGVTIRPKKNFTLVTAAASRRYGYTAAYRCAVRAVQTSLEKEKDSSHP